MLQAEVADRLVGRGPGPATTACSPCSPRCGADVEPLLALPPGAFRPVPTVRSALVRLRFRPLPAGVTRPSRGVPAGPHRVHPAAQDHRQRAEGPRDGRRASTRGPSLRAAGIDPMRRPETLQLVEFSALADAWAAPGRCAIVLAQPACQSSGRFPAVRNVGSSASAIGVADDRREPARLRQLACVPCAASRSGAWLGYLCPCRVTRRQRLRSMSCRWAGSASSA